MSEEESLMIGSYPPASVPHSFEFPKFGFNEAPKGMVSTSPLVSLSLSHYLSALPRQVSR